MNDMSGELKACPFCYPHPACDEYPPYITQEIADSGAWCVHAPCCDFYGPLSSTKEEATRKWNTRDQLPNQGGEAVAWRVTGAGGLTVAAEYPRWAEDDSRLLIEPLYTHPADPLPGLRLALGLLTEDGQGFMQNG